MHTHGKAELYCFMGGGGVFHIEGAEYALEPGDILIMAPWESHYIELDCTQPYDRWSIHFEKELFQSVDPHGLLMRPFVERKPGTLNLYKSYEFKGGSRHYWEEMTAGEGESRLNILAGMFSLLNEIYGIYLSRDAEIYLPLEANSEQLSSLSAPCFPAAYLALVKSGAAPIFLMANRDDMIYRLEYVRFAQEQPIDTLRE